MRTWENCEKNQGDAVMSPRWSQLRVIVRRPSFRADQVTELADLDLLQPGLVSPAVQRSGRLRLIVFGSKHIEGIEHGPFVELTAIQAVHAVIVGDRQDAACQVSNKRHPPCGSAQTQK